MEPPQKTKVSYTDDDGKNRVISILPEQIQYYDRWRKIKQGLENGKWNAENRQKAYDAMEKCLKLFACQKSNYVAMTCECGATVNRGVIARHRATTKHSKRMEQLEKEEMPTEPIELADTDKICECGQIVSKANYARHLIGSRHAKHMVNK